MGLIRTGETAQEREEMKWDGWEFDAQNRPDRQRSYYERVTGEARHYPRMLYRAAELSTGKTVCGADEFVVPGSPTPERLKTTMIVKTELEAVEMLSNGWHPDPRAAIAAREAQLLSIARAAATRAHDDRRMSASAQSEAAAANAVSGLEHVLDVPVPKKRGRKPHVLTEG